MTSILHLFRVLFTGYWRPSTPAEVELRRHLDSLRADVETATAERSNVADTLTVRTLERDLLASVVERERRRVAAETMTMTMTMPHAAWAVRAK